VEKVQVRGECDDEGRFELFPRSQAPCRLVAWCDEGSRGGTVVMSDVVRHEASRALELVLVPVEPVVVAARDDRGAPLEGVTLQIQRVGTEGRGILASEHETTDATGTASFGVLPAGRWRVDAALGWQRASLEIESPPRTDADGRPVFVFAAPASVSGRVFDATGAPLADARVGITEGSGSADGWGVATLYTGTDRLGRYRFSSLTAGRYMVRAFERELPLAQQPVELVAREARDDVDLRLSPPAAIEVEVLDGDGRPEPGRAVGCSLPDANFRLERRADEAGHVRFERVPPGQVVLERLREKTPSSFTGSIGIERHEPLGGRVRANVVLEPGERRRVVLGGALGAATVLRGRALVGTRVDPELWVEARDACERSHGKRRVGSAGEFELEVHDAPIRLVFELEQARVERELPAGSDTHTFELPAGEIRGVVRPNGARPAEWHVVLSCIDGDGRGVDWGKRLPADGSFRFPLLEPGRYEIVPCGDPDLARVVAIGGEPVELELVIP
jgi:hypothetical protein